MGRYSNTLIQRNREGRRYYAANRYVEIPRSNNDLYVITTDEDRYDLLADQYYGDSTLWWAISSANYGSKQDSYYPPQGVQLRIPSNIQGLILNFESVNR